MRFSIFRFIVLGAVLTGAVASVRAQSLADVAKKEENRRRTAKNPAKVYTNKDLGAAAAGTPDAAPDADASASADAKDAADPKAPSATKDGKTADTKDTAKGADDKKSGDTKDQAYWSKRMSGLREALQRDQVYADALQSRINALTTDFVNRDDPAQRAQIGTQRETATNELNRLKKQIEDDKRAVSDAEEEARRSGVPSGWLR
jgi:hypothetical protein